MICVVNKKRKLEKIKAEYPDAEILDVTSTSDNPKWQKLSPFYPHGGVPVPGMDCEATCVEAVWQGLKTFESEGYDSSVFRNDTMLHLKRTIRRLGILRGHWLGSEQRCLEYLEARGRIYLPTYKWVLDHKVKEAVEEIRGFLREGKVVVLLDYNTNTDYRDTSRPLSHAGLIMRYVQDEYPVFKEGVKSMLEDEVKELKLQENEIRKACSREAISRSKGEACLFNVNG